MNAVPNQPIIGRNDNPASIAIAITMLTITPTMMLLTFNLVCALSHSFEYMCHKIAQKAIQSNPNKGRAITTDPHRACELHPKS